MKRLILPISTLLLMTIGCDNPMIVAFSVNVNKTTSLALTDSEIMRRRIRCNNVAVFPVPAPAKIIKGAAGWLIALF